MALTDNIVAYWKMDESSGNISDSVDSHTGTNVNGVTFAPGIINNGADIELSSSQHFTVPDSDDWNFGAGNFSISLWVKFESLTNDTNQQFIMQYEDGNNRWMLGTTASGANHNVRFFANDGGVTKALYDSSGDEFASTGVWYHVVLVRNGTSVLVYINNSSVSLTEITPIGTNDLGNHVGSLYMGIYGTGTELKFDGLMDEVGIWKGKALTAGEVGELYNNGEGLQYPFTTATATHFLNLLGVGT